MERIEKNRTFIQSLVHTGPKKRKKNLKQATDDEIKSLVEILYNLRELPLTKNETKTLKPYSKQFKKFFKARWGIEKFKKYFIDHNQILPLVISIVLCKLFD